MALDALKTAFPGRVATPDAMTTAHEVAQGLGIITRAGTKFALRTSGHNPTVGFNNADETGVVLDLQGLLSKELRDGEARVGMGNTWGDVYAWLEEHSLSAIGGREHQVGVDGFLLGGKSLLHGGEDQMLKACL